jgi:hypothetical protein
VPDGIAKAQLAERMHGIGSEQKRESKLAGGSGTLEDADVPPCASQRHSGGETADPGSDN